MGILSQILGAGDVIKKGMDLIDDMHTSDEEMVEAKTKAKVSLMQSYAPFKLAQRYIALMFTFTFLLCFFLTLVLTLLGYGDPEKVLQIVNQFWIGEIMLTIVGFYFSGGFVEGIITTRNQGKASEVKL